MAVDTGQSDLRSFLAEAEEAGKLHRVARQVDPEGNLAGLCDQSDRAIEFDDIAGYPDWRVVANLGVNRALESVAFGVPTDQVVGAVAAALDRGPRPPRTVEAKDAPVKQEIWRGEDADVRRLPVAVHSELDGGRYIGGGIGVVVDPDTGLHNTTFPRFQVANGRECPLYIYSPHVTQIMGKFTRLQKPMPMAIVIGHHPAWEIAAASSMHHPTWGELDLVGSLLDEPTEYVRCETVDLEVPARAEIVIEGQIVPGVLQDEGPFGNYLGTYASGPLAREGVQKAPVFQVSCITKRSDAIYRHCQSTTWTDHQRLVMLPNEANLLIALREMGLDVHDVYCPPWGGCSLTVLQMTPHTRGEVRDALLKASEWHNTTLGFMSQVAVAVNRDVNLYDARDVVWAMTIRTNWANDARFVEETRSSPLFPAGERIPGSGWRLGSKAMIDATHLPPRDESERWDYYRVQPVGLRDAALADFVDGAAGTPLEIEHEPAQIEPPRVAEARQGTTVTLEAEGDSDGEWTTVAKLSDLAEGAGTCVAIGSQRVALFRIGDEVHALQNTCPHAGGSLADGFVDDEDATVTCPLHGWTFDVRSGSVMGGSIPAQRFDVEVEADAVRLRLTPVAV